MFHSIQFLTAVGGVSFVDIRTSVAGMTTVASTRYEIDLCGEFSLVYTRVNALLSVDFMGETSVFGVKPLDKMCSCLTCHMQNVSAGAGVPGGTLPIDHGVVVFSHFVWWLCVQPQHRQSSVLVSLHTAGCELADAGTPPTQNLCGLWTVTGSTTVGDVTAGET